MTRLRAAAIARLPFSRTPTVRSIGSPTAAGRSSPLSPEADLLDARGLYCPLPVLRTRERFKTLPPGSRLDVVADDPLARLDMQAFCAREGHAYLGELEEPSGGWRMALRKARGARS